MARPAGSRAGLPENRLPRSTRAGTITWHPDSARRRSKAVLGANSRLHAHQLLRSYVGIRQRNDLCDGGAVSGPDQQSLAPQARQDVPTNAPDRHRIALGQGLPSLGREKLQPGRGPAVDHSDDLAEPIPVGFDRPGVAGLGGEVSVPERRSTFRRRLQAPHQETVDPGHHASRQIALPAQLGGAGQLSGLLGPDRGPELNQKNQSEQKDSLPHGSEHYLKQTKKEWSASARAAARQAAACPLEQLERWEEAPPGNAGVPPACYPVACRSVSLRCGTAHPAGGNATGSAEAESRPRCRSTRVEEMAEAVPEPVRAGRPRSQGGASSTP